MKVFLVARACVILYFGAFFDRIERKPTQVSACRTRRTCGAASARSNTIIFHMSQKHLHMMECTHLHLGRPLPNGSRQALETINPWLSSHIAAASTHHARMRKVRSWRITHFLSWPYQGDVNLVFAVPSSSTRTRFSVFSIAILRPP